MKTFVVELDAARAIEIEASGWYLQDHRLIFYIGEWDNKTITCVYNSWRGVYEKGGINVPDDKQQSPAPGWRPIL